MKINKIFSGLALALAVFAGSGCQKVLDQAPYAAFTDESVFTTPERALLALNGVYDAAQTGFYPGGQRGYPFGAANVQQNDCRGEDMVNIAAFYQITYQATYNPTTANNVGMWNALYGLINKANISIDGFRRAGQAGVISQALATQYEAECRFLRAMAHHELAVHFCRPYLDGNGSQLGIPYRDFAVTGSVTVDRVRTDPRPRLDTVYSKILQDLNFAEANLPVTNNPAVVRAERAAAIAMKMRVRMHMGLWNEVRTEGNKLIPATLTPTTPTSVVSLIGNRSLTAAANGSFAANSTSSENIFTIRNDALDNPGVNGALASQYGSADLGGRGLVAVSPIIWNNTMWRNDDTRRTLLYRTGTNSNAVPNIMTTKYSDYVNRGDFNPIIRWAEVLLMQAEAEARLSVGTVSQRAVDLLNVVRNRSIPSPATNQYTVASFANDVEEINAILMERRIEFLAEGKRWPDIHRTAQDPIAALRPVGIPAKVINGGVALSAYGFGLAVTPGQAAIPYADFRFIWPIPAEEVTQNPIVVQNPGY